MEQTTRKLAIHKALHPREKIDSMCQKKEKETSQALKIAWMYLY